MKLPANYDLMSWQERRAARLQYIGEQGGKCAHCGEPLHLDPREDIRKKRITKSLFPESFFKHPVHLHHDHDTGMTIGAVHCKCNAVLWEYHGK